jgi:SAM-dependent methyltransferase
MADLPPAVHAFDSIADSFDERFGPALSVAAQRRAVRAAFAETFPVGSKLVEIGGGTGEDACWLLKRGRDVLVTDASPAMIAVAASKLRRWKGGQAEVAPAEDLTRLLERRRPACFDGAFSNFAALNCVADLGSFAGGLARLLRPGAPALLVMFGTFCPAEMLLEAIRGRPDNMFRRLGRGAGAARLGGRDFTIHYHGARAIRQAMRPWFEPRGREAIGLFVPPSAAEPWISRHPRLLAMLERLDSALARPLAPLGDHILYSFVRTDAEARQ